MYEGIKGAILLSVIAMVVVFVVLSLLALMMVGLRKIVKSSSKSISKEQVVVKKGDLPVVPVKEKDEISAVVSQDEEIVSVITAAIANYMSMSPSLQSANVINIKRITPQTLNPWAISGRQKIMTERTYISTRKKGGI